MGLQKATHKTKVACPCGHSMMVPNNGERVKCICGAYLRFREDGPEEITPIATVIKPDTYPYIDKRPVATEDWRRIKK